MNLKKIILDFYKSEALINPTVLASYLHDDIVFELTSLLEFKLEVFEEEEGGKLSKEETIAFVDLILASLLLIQLIIVLKEP
jgi:hypothetical protein